MHSNDSNAEPVKDYVIDRATWLRGEGAYRSSLLRPEDGKMCCLGQIALQRGYTEEEIRGRADPVGLPDWNENWPCRSDDEGYFFLLSTLEEMMEHNDDLKISDELRELDLIELGKELGWDLTFIN